MNEFITMALSNKDFWTTIITIGIFSGIVLPLLNKQNKDTLLIMKDISETIKMLKDIIGNHTLDDAKVQTLILEKLEEHRQEAHIQFERIAQNSFKTILDGEKTIDLLKTQMFYVTDKKLDFIKSIILNNHIKGNEVTIREKLFQGLTSLSDEYLSKFSTYQTPLGDLSKWLMNTFGDKEFNKLIDQIMEIIYREYEGKDNDIALNKIDQVRMIMKTIQVGLANQLRKDITKIN